MKTWIAVTICLFTLVSFVQSADAQLMQLPEIDKYFAVAFEQHGQLIPIANHQITLEKNSFSIVLFFKEPGSVLVNASLQSESFEQARDGVAFEQIQGFTDLGMAEEPFNPKTLLMLSKQAPHYWYYEDASKHRFNDVRWQEGLLVCRRIVAQVMYREKGRATLPLRDMRENAIYFVFMRTIWNQDFSGRFEQQREYVTVNFR
ncbi:hypothetical protein CSA57_09730 [candidate division KSB3 bacterium]|nr:MAG: hypothetical protein CSA57_09730 [candidate division KSB3 bacterium]